MPAGADTGPCLADPGQRGEGSGDGLRHASTHGRSMPIFRRVDLRTKCSIPHLCMIAMTGTNVVPSASPMPGIIYVPT